MEQRFRLSNGFQIGLTGGLGVLVAILVGNAVAQTAAILTYVAIALFIALGLDPLVRSLTKRKVPRPLAVLVAVVIFLGSLTLLLWAIIPVAISEAAKLISQVPAIASSLVTTDLISQWDAQLGGAITTATDGALAFVTDAGKM